MPDSIKGVSAAKHSLLTWRRASKLSKPFMTRSKDLKKSTSYWDSLTLPCITAGQVIIGSCGYNVVLGTACILTCLAWLFHEAMAISRSNGYFMKQWLFHEAMDGCWAVQVPCWQHVIVPDYQTQAKGEW